MTPSPSEPRCAYFYEGYHGTYRGVCDRPESWHTSQWYEHAFLPPPPKAEGKEG